MSEEKIIDRIKKLLSLANSANENEAALAAALAAELMLKHEIAEARLVEDGGELLEDVNAETIDHTASCVAWKGLIANGLAESLGCKMYYGRARVDGKRVRSYVIVGQESKRSAIKYMYQYLVAELDRLSGPAYRMEVLECKHSDVPPPSARSWKNAFRLGAATTIHGRLTEQRKKTHKAAKAAGESQALIVVARAEEAVAAYMKKNIGKIHPGKLASYSSGSGFGAGRSAGRDVGLGSGSKALGRGGSVKQLGTG